jgi:hypothetical protein
VSLRDLIYGAGEPSEERFLSSLERIANALEVLARLERPVDETQGDTSDVLYTDELTDYEKELAREAYTSRTGRKLSEGEDPPSHGPKD